MASNSSNPLTNCVHGDENFEVREIDSPSSSSSNTYRRLDPIIIIDLDQARHTETTRRTIQFERVELSGPQSPTKRNSPPTPAKTGLNQNSSATIRETYVHPWLRPRPSYCRQPTHHNPTVPMGGAVREARTSVQFPSPPGFVLRAYANRQMQVPPATPNQPPGRSRPLITRVQARSSGSRVDSLGSTRRQTAGRNDGRTRSIRDRAQGTYVCPKCFQVCPSAQHFAAHIASGHYKFESREERERRVTARLEGKRKLRLVYTSHGLTMIPDQAAATGPSMAVTGKHKTCVVKQEEEGAGDGGLQIFSEKVNIRQDYY